MINLLTRAALALVLLLGSLGTSVAAPQDYRFEVLNQPVKAAHDAVLTVRITQTTTNQPITNATITGQKLHMMMGSMDDPAKIRPLSQDDKGNYRFSADVTMYGEWTLDLTAAIPHEKDPVPASLKLQVAK